MENHFFSWENQLFLWPSIQQLCNKLREGKVLLSHHFCWLSLHFSWLNPHVLLLQFHCFVLQDNVQENLGLLNHGIPVDFAVNEPTSWMVIQGGDLYLAKLVRNSNNYGLWQIYHTMVYKPTYNWAAPPCNSPMNPRTKKTYQIADISDMPSGWWFGT